MKRKKTLFTVYSLDKFRYRHFWETDSDTNTDPHEITANPQLFYLSVPVGYHRDKTAHLHT